MQAFDVKCNRLDVFQQLCSLTLSSQDFWTELILRTQGSSHICRHMFAYHARRL